MSNLDSLENRATHVVLEPTTHHLLGSGAPPLSYQGSSIAGPSQGNTESVSL